MREVAALGLVCAVLAGCGAEGAQRAGRNGVSSSTVSPAPAAEPSRVPTLAPGPGGLTPVFMNGSRDLGKTVALTFDADMTADQGPRAAAGEQFDNPGLIAALRGLKVPSTVFMTGRWAEQYPDQARSIGRDPLFEVANHSYSHHAFTGDCYGLPTVPPERMRSDVERAYASFRKVGVPDPMPYFRFPGGCYDDRALKALVPAGVTAVQWDVVGGDAFATDSRRGGTGGAGRGAAGFGGRPALHEERGPDHRAGDPGGGSEAARARVPVREGVGADRADGYGERPGHGRPGRARPAVRGSAYPDRMDEYRARPARSGPVPSAPVPDGDEVEYAECVLCRERTEYPETHKGITLCPVCEWHEAQRSACSG